MPFTSQVPPVPFSHRLTVSLLLVALSLAPPASAQVKTIRFGEPGEGDIISNCFPFACWRDGLTGYQQIFSADLFGNRPLVISEMRFIREVPCRREESQCALTLSNLVIRFSTTSVSSETMSPDLASNFGIHTETFFDQAIHFTERSERGLFIGEPYLYDPRQGNLLFDIVMSHHPGGGSELETIPTASCTRGYSFLDPSGDYPPEAGVDEHCLITWFTVEVVPEPRTVVLLASGMVGLLGIGIRGRGRRVSNQRGP